MNKNCEHCGSTTLKVVLGEDEMRVKDRGGNYTDSPYANAYCGRCGVLAPVGRARAIMGGRRG